MKKAFTLAELLISLTLVSVLAVITIPNVTADARSKAYVALLHTTYNQLVNSFREARATQGVSYVSDFDFSHTTDVESQEQAFFDIYFNVQKRCGSSFVPCFADAYKDIEGNVRTDLIGNGANVILSNGVAVGISKDFFKYIYIDVNNVDPPNVLGRDFFVLPITEKGELSSKDMYAMDSLSDLASDCRSFDGYLFTCFDYIIQNNWKLDY